MIMKKTSTLKLLTSLAIVTLMCLSLILPAIAVEYAKGDYETGVSAKAAITKVFKIPVETTLPEAKFTFEFKKEGMWLDNKLDATAGAKADMPDIGPIEIEFDKDFLKLEKGDHFWYVKESDNILKDVPMTEFGHGVGIYVYTVSEKQEGITIDDEDKETAVYSEGEYTVQIWVDYDKEGILFVQYIVVIINEKHDEVWEDEDVDEKVDPTPGGSTTSLIEGHSNFIFTNKYYKTDGGGGTEKHKNAALTITKSTTGNMSNTSTEFAFVLTVKQPSIISETTKYEAFLLDKDDNIIGGPYEVTTGVPFEIAKIKHGEKFVVVDLHVGAEVNIYEKPHADYRSSYVRTFANTSPTYNSFTAPAPDMKWGFAIEENPDDNRVHYLPEATPGANRVEFTNTHKPVTPTGLDVDDLPYMLLLGLSVAGLAGFAIVRSRQRSAK